MVKGNIKCSPFNMPLQQLLFCHQMYNNPFPTVCVYAFTWRFTIVEYSIA